MGFVSLIFGEFPQARSAVSEIGTQEGRKWLKWWLLFPKPPRPSHVLILAGAVVRVARGAVGQRRLL
jgi:hypothetical protein